MPVVVVELPSPAPPGVAHALIDACSQSVREGRCVLATEPDPEPPGARAAVTWDEASELIAHVEVEVTSGETRGSRRRTIVFKQSDARVERWRTVGLTIATLVGDVLHPGESGATPESSGALPPPEPSAEQPSRGTGEQEPSPASAHPEQNPETGTMLIPSKKNEGQDVHRAPPPERRLHTTWVSVAAITGPGLERGYNRFGAGIDFGYRPTKLPVFARIAVAYTLRPEDKQGVSVEWETLSIGAGAVFPIWRFDIEPRLSLGIENVHGSVTDPATQRSDAGNQLGVNGRAGIDIVWPWPRVGIVGSFEGWRAHAPTRIVVAGRDSGVSAPWGWQIALGGRFYLD